MITRNQIKLVRSLSHKKFRDETGLFVAEGKKLVEDLQQDFEVEFIITPADATSKQIEQLSALRSPQGYIGVFRQKHSPLPTVSGQQLLLALDGVQDPGNLGTIIRTADWFGVRDIVCSLQTADCYNPKVVQATMGAISRVRVHYTELTGWLQAAAASVPVYGTLLNGKDIYNETLSNSGIIVMGNEGNGISQDVRRLITNPLLIPSYPAAEKTSESLNVSIATAVTLAEFRRRT